MIGKVETTIPNTKTDIHLAHGDAAKAKAKKARPEERPDAPQLEAETEEPLSTAPVHIRHLGRKLDLIA
jgi:hypothetical protein